MKFRTEIEPFDSRFKIGYTNRILTLGSCFADHIGRRLSTSKFNVVTNPTGVLFNPLSIAAAIHEATQPVTEEGLHHGSEGFFHYGFHGDFSSPTPAEALQRMNTARQRLANALHDADRVVLTLGTAWVYEHCGVVVANCHRQPTTEFIRRRLTVGEVVDVIARLATKELSGKQIVLTLSPVRHVGDTLSGNAVSKATLRLAIEELTARFEHIAYFPAYEMVIDDLRDYRFYAEDLVHPSPQAVEYVWEHFAEAFFEQTTCTQLAEVEQIVQAAAHRPRNPHSEAHRTFCQRMLARIDALPNLDFHAERAYFRQSLEINS